jgi:hypothetical protein
MAQSACGVGRTDTQNTLSRAPQDVVLSVVPKTAQRYARSDRLGFCRDQSIDAAPLEGTIDLRVRNPASAVTVLMSTPVVALTSSTWGAIISPSFFSPVVTSTSRVTPILSRVLLITRLKMSVARVCGHRRVRIGHADFLGLAALPILLFALDVVLVEHLDHVTLDKAHYLTAAAINLKRLAAALFALLCTGWRDWDRSRSVHPRPTLGQCCATDSN